MRLNNFSYVHRHIRMLCNQLEQETGLKLVTNMSGNISGIRFESELAYLIIDFKNGVAYLLSIKLSRKQEEMLLELMAFCSWIDLGEKFSTKNTKNF